MLHSQLLSSIIIIIKLLWNIARRCRSWSVTDFICSCAKVNVSVITRLFIASEINGRNIKGRARFVFQLIMCCEEMRVRIHLLSVSFHNCLNKVDTVWHCNGNLVSGVYRKSLPIMWNYVSTTTHGNRIILITLTNPKF